MIQQSIAQAQTLPELFAARVALTPDAPAYKEAPGQPRRQRPPRTIWPPLSIPVSVRVGCRSISAIRPTRHFSYTTASLVSSSGLLTAGTSDRLELRMTDDMAVGAGNTLAFDTSHLNFLFTVSPVPDPSTGLMFDVGLVALRARRRRSGDKALRS